MQTTIRFHALEASDALREHVHRAAETQLDRLRDEVTAIRVTLADENGPRGGADKRCQVTLSGPRVGVVTIDERNADVYAAVDLALARAAQSTARRLARRRRLRVQDNPPSA